MPRLIQKIKPTENLCPKFLRVAAYARVSSGKDAQEESRSVSENCKWRIRNDFAQGKVCSMKMLGYRRTKDGSLEVNADEAEIVKYIFALYLSGYGKLKISNILNEEHIPTLNGCEWTPGSVRRILDNEKYAGNMLLQKTFRENHITKKCRKNKGELQMYYVEESHEAIIEPSEFEAIKSITEKRQEKYSAPKHSDKYPFTGKIQCERCGKNYRRKTTATGIVWICSTFNTKGKKYCPTAKQIPETTLIAACCEMLKLLNFDVEKFNEQIERITVPSPNHLTFYFKDGTIENAVWKDRSRSESWTDEMKANAAETTKTRRWNK